MASNLTYQGLNIASYWKNQLGSRAYLESLDDAKDLGANTIAITSTHYMANQYATGIYASGKTEPDSAVEQSIIDAKANGFNVVLKPHVDLANSQWRGRLDPGNMDTFFSNYEKFIVNQAKIAQKAGADILAIGTEIDHLMKEENRKEWKEIIDSVRDVYDGKLTIAANWDSKATIWDLVDYIGINPYVKMDTNNSGSVGEYMAALDKPVQDDYLAKQIKYKSPFDFWKGLSEQYGKKVIFTELGYRSVDGAATDPASFRKGGSVDETEQAQLFEAFMRTFANESWVEGTLIWDWSVDLDAAKSRSDFKSGFTIEGKKAEGVIDRFYDSEPGSEGTTPIKVSMAANGSGVKAAIVVDRVLVDEVSVTNGLTNGKGFRDYTIDVPKSLLYGSDHTVEVHFVNPRPGTGLHTADIEVKGRTYQMQGEKGGFVTSYNKGTVAETDLGRGFDGASTPSSTPAPSYTPKPAPKPEPAPQPESRPEPVAKAPEPAKAPSKPASSGDNEVVLNLASVNDGGAARVAVYMDNRKLGEATVRNETNDGFKEYTFKAWSSLIDRADGEISVQFLNPKAGRGLQIESASIDGKNYDLGGSDDFTTMWSARSLSIGPDGAVASSRDSSKGSFNNSSGDGKTDVLVSLASVNDGGDARAAVYVEGRKIGETRVWNDLDDGFRDYKFTVADSLVAGDGKEVEVKFLNPTPGRGLEIDAVTIDDTRYEAENPWSDEDHITAFSSKIVSAALTGKDELRVIDGTSGNDRLNGTGGDDFIDSGRGNDVLSSGGGEDVFAIELEAGARDTILDYDPGEDSVQYEGGRPTSVSGSNVSNGALVTIQDGDATQQVMVNGVRWWEIDQDFVL